MASPHLLLPSPSQAAAACTALCCACGVPTPPNPANTCARCLRGAPRHSVVVRCPSCSSYLEPPRRWTRAAPDSPELKHLLLRRVRRRLPRLGASLSGAELVFTEPHSKRLKLRIRLRLRLRIRREVRADVAVEKSHVVEFTVHDRLCDSCGGRARRAMDQCGGGWSAVRASHRRTLLHLQQRLAALGAAGSATRVVVPSAGGGLDFFFASRSHAASLVSLISSMAPARTDSKSNCNSHSNTTHAFSVELCPVCRDDLVFLPREASGSLGGLGPLVLCVKVTDVLALLDVSTLRVVHLGMKEYDWYKFEPALTSRQLVEYIVLDVDAGEAMVSGHRAAYAQVARASELGKKDAIFTVRTHLGDLLSPGDRALGYDLRHGVNLDDVVGSNCLPDAVLVNKIHEKGGGGKLQQDGSSSRSDGVGIDEIAMGIGCIDLNPSDEVELDELFEDLRM
ncbi:hypothetical protein BRADI_2g61273v3 [Brachypodium distachyon]|uniref:60S ribosomal export protein NMD3 n=1 Tax=Brachypodium distachyon TaxID=15368 RepID=A0A0Q3N4L3_BRADI|nr:hypothetical protein BRADI_2g61273v3 [Brachypodium distachyon]